jgi:stage IV sporulation protein FB
MDGGRVLRALLALVIGYGKATKISVGLGHLFAFIFAYFGIIRFNMILVVIAVFIYMAASSEGLQVDIKESLKKFKVRDILPRDFVTINKSTSLSQVLEFIFHSHQEDFPVADGKDIVGFVTRQDIMSGLHSLGPGTKVGDIMRTDFPVIKDTDSLARAQDVMNEKSARAMPVMRDGHVAGIITLEDIGRAYAVISQKS